MKKSTAKLRICGIDVPIYIDDTLLMDTDSFGTFTPSNPTMTIAGDCDEKSARASLWHETFEAINHIYGGIHLNHDQIELLSTALNQIHEDNNIDEILVGLGGRS